MKLNHILTGCLLLLAGLTFGIAGCETSQHARGIRSNSPVKLTQAFNESTPQRMTSSAARKFLKETNLTQELISVLDNDATHRYIAKSLGPMASYQVGEIILTNTELIFISADSRVAHMARLSNILAISYDEPFLEVGGFKNRFQPGKENMLYIPDPQLGLQVADAILIVKETAAAEALKEEAGFERALQSYQNAAAKPEFTEDVRRFKVQAENAVREKRYGNAVSLYEKALNIAPWWAEGHFNRAMMLSEISVFETAVLEMGRYLKLEPNAANARAAQDKIYEWEAKIK